MNKWYMLTLVGNDSPGIVAKVTQALYENNYNLGETSMLRLGGNFSIMMMVNADDTEEAIAKCLSDVCRDLGFRLHIDAIDGRLHQHHIPNAMIMVSGADRHGIIAQVTGALFEAGFDILNLDSDVAGTTDQPIYIMRIEGIAPDGADSLSECIEKLKSNGVDVTLHPIDTLVG